MVFSIFTGLYSYQYNLCLDETFHKVNFSSKIQKVCCGDTIKFPSRGKPTQLWEVVM